jgi:hypothetical protein
MRKLGWVRPLVKFPGEFWKPSHPFPTSYPSKYILDCNHLPATDTGDEPASHIHAVCAALDLGHNLSRPSQSFHPSPSFIRRSMYNPPCPLAGDLNHSITDVIRHIIINGYVSESDCPYQLGCETDPLSDELIHQGHKHKNSQWANISLSLQVFRLALMAGYPIVCGIVAFPRIESIQDASEGLIVLEPSGTWPMTGCGLCVVGWDDSRQAFRVRTPFGALWGDGGYGWIDYRYILQTSTSDDHYVFLSV